MNNNLPTKLKKNVSWHPIKLMCDSIKKCLYETTVQRVTCTTYGEVSFLIHDNHLALSQGNYIESLLKLQCLAKLSQKREGNEDARLDRK